MCKFGVCEWCMPTNGPFSIALAKAAGFEGVQISDLGGAGQGFPLSDPAVQEGYLQAAADHGIELQSLHPHGLQREGTMLFPLDSPQGQEAQLSIEKDLDVCVAMNIPSLMISSFFATQIRNEWEFDMYAQHLKRTCEMGRDRGIEIVYESILSPKQIHRMIDYVGDDLKICYDVVNPLRYTLEDSLGSMFEIGLEHIDHLHVKDLPADLKGYAPMGDGVGHVAEIVKSAIDAGYNGWLISENYYTLQAVSEKKSFLELAKNDVQWVKELLKKQSS